MINIIGLGWLYSIAAVSSGGKTAQYDFFQMLGSVFSGRTNYTYYDKMLIFFVILSFVLALCAGVFLFLFLRKRYNFQQSIISSKFPMRVFVIKRNGDLLYYQIDERDRSESKFLSPKKVSDFSGDSFDFVMSKVKDVLDNEEPLHFSFRNEDRIRNVILSKLPYDTFNCECALWISQDGTKLYEISERLKGTNSVLEYANSVFKIVHFEYSPQNGISIAVPDEFWANVNSKPIDFDKWIYKDDVDKFIKNWHALTNNEVTEIKFTYRSNFHGNMKYFMMVASRRRDGGDESDVFFGVIQDITQLTQVENDYAEANFMLQSLIENLPLVFGVQDVANDFCYILCNSYNAELFDNKSDGIIGKNDFDLFENHELAAELRVNDEKTVAMYPEVMKMNEKVNGRFYEMRKVGIKDQNGRMLLVSFGIDVTEQYQLNCKLEESNRILKQQNSQDAVINELMKMLVFNLDFRSSFEALIDCIKKNSEARRCVVLKLDFENNDIVNYFESAEFGIADGRLSKISDYPLSITHLKQHKHCFISLSDENKFIDEYKAILNEHLTGTMLLFGIWNRNMLWGVLSVELETILPQAPSSLVRLLSSAAKIGEIVLEREHLNKAMSQTEKQRRVILDMMETPVMLFDKNMNLLHVNPAAEIMANRSVAEIKLEPCYVSFCHAGCVPDDCPVKLALSGKRSKTRKELNHRTYQINTQPIYDNGEVVNVVSTYLDVTELEENQLKLMQAMEQAQNANKAKSNFIATMSHELRTPLNAVIGFSELLQSANLEPEKQLEYLKSINLAGNALLNLINDVLDLSKLEAQQVTIRPEKINLRSLCYEMEAIFRTRAESKGLYFRLDLGLDIPHLKLDILRLRQIFLNLIGNAVKFTHDGGITLKVEFEKNTEHTGVLKIKISDTGIGVAPDKLEAIFEPFVQDENRRGQYSVEGTGLGLPISRKLARKMNGDIVAENLIDGGSTFILTINEVDYFMEKTEHNLEIGTESNSILYKHRVLIVDDVPLNRKVLEAMMKKENMDTRLASSGAEALTELERFNPDMICTDMWMPEMNGAELAALIRKNERYGKLGIFAVTADTEAINNFDMTPFDGVILKPITQEKIKKVLAMLESRNFFGGGGGKLFVMK